MLTNLAVRVDRTSAKHEAQLDSTIVYRVWFWPWLSKQAHQNGKLSRNLSDITQSAVLPNLAVRVARLAKHEARKVSRQRTG